MAAYRADIQIGVSGQRELERLRSAITQTSEAAESLNRIRVNGGRLAQSLENYNTQLERAQRNLRVVATASDAESKAITEYVTALGSANAARARQNNLIEDEIRLQQTAARVSRLAVAGIRETSGTAELGPGPASPVGSLVGQKSSVDDIIRRTLQGKQDEIELQAALLRLEEKSATALNEKIELQYRLNRAALEQGKTDVERVSAQQAERQQFLAGKSGPAVQGPLAPAGAMGFPVALSLSKVEQQGIQAANTLEQKGIETAAKKQAILQRMAATRQDLVGLAANLQRLDQNSVVAIADAARGEVKLVELKKKKAELAAAALKTSQAETKAAVALAQQQQQTLEAQRKERSGMIQNAMIGGAFPMLFGGGAGAVLGGAAGGFIPGNPMMSIVTSALGTMVDEFAAAAIAVGAALMDTATTFDFVKEKSLFSSKELEKYATKLQEAGFVASASAVAQSEIITKVGNKGVEDLATLASESDNLNRAFAELTVQMQAFIAGPLAVLLEQMAAVVGQATTAQRAKVLEENLRAQGKTAAADKLASRVQGAQLKGLGQSFNFSNVDPLNPLSLVAPNTKATGNINEEIQGIINEFEKIELKPKIKLTPEQINKQDLAVLEKRLEAISIGKSLTDAVKQAAREQKDLDKQRADLVRSYEESIGSIRKKVEDEVSRRRFSILEKENQLLDLQGQNRIKQLQAANAQEIALAGRGERSEVASVAKEVAQIVANFTEQQLSAEEEAAKIKRNAALDARKFDFEAAQFKANIEKEVAKLNIETARRVADINEKVRSRNEETDSRKFDIEKSIARIKIIQLKNELAAASFRADLDDVDKRSIQQSIDNLTTTQAVIKNLEPPAPLRGVGQVGGGGVSTTNFDAIVSKEKGAIQALVNEALKGIDLTVKGSREALAQNLLNVTDKIDQSLKDIETKEADAEVNRLRRIELINAGLTEGVAQRVMELEQLKKITLAQYDAIIAYVEGKIIKEATTKAQLATNEALRQEIELIKERKAALEGNLGTFDATTGTGTGAIGNATTSQAGKQIQEFITTATAELNNLEQVAINVSKGIGDAVGNSLASGISGLIEGTTSAKEVFATFLRDIGQMLVEQGTKMIATYIAIGIARIFAGIASSAGSTPTPGSAPQMTPGAVVTPTGFQGQFAGMAANGATFANGIAKFASGGIVSSPTLFKFADGGTTRTGLMGEAGPEAILPLSRGPGGKLGVMASGGGGGDVNVVVNVDAKGSSVEGNEQGANQLGRVISAAVQSELIKQQRPGGILAR